MYDVYLCVIFSRISFLFALVGALLRAMSQPNYLARATYSLRMFFNAPPNFILCFGHVIQAPFFVWLCYELWFFFSCRRLA